jgi:hypothetical protein
MRRHGSLEDFLIESPLTVNERFGEGSGPFYPVKGREIDATVMFADMSDFTARSRELTPVQTLILVNNFVSWLTNWAVQASTGIVDKYIGDELMIVFSNEFGSEDPFADAIRTSRWIGQHDMQGFRPHIGLASGRVVAGYVGTTLRYEASVFGRPVALAARCAKSPSPTDTASGGVWGTSIVFPADEWTNDRVLEDLVPPDRKDLESEWRLLEPRSADFGGLGRTMVRDLVRDGIWIWASSPEVHAIEQEALMRKHSTRYEPQG